VGIEGFPYQYPTYVPRDAKERSHRAPHNTYLQCITETGVLGTLPFFFLLFWTFQGSWRLHQLTRRELGDGSPNPRGDPLIASLSLYLIFSLTTFCVAATFITAMTMDILWVIFGLASVLPLLHAERFADDNTATSS
jgi:O-antigen ligase